MVFISAGCNWWLWNCIQGNMGNLQIRRTFFLAFIGADSNQWLWNKKLHFNNFVIGRGGRGKVDVKFWTFAVVAGGCTKIKQVQARVEEGYKFWWFYENIKIKCPWTCFFWGNLGIPDHTCLIWYHFEEAFDVYLQKFHPLRFP